jgi:NAD-dependent dihydropyrimidine dehydrogenase PreA subunit
MSLSKIPREEIPWYPSINYNLCLKDNECVKFCQHGVYEWNETEMMPKVTNPFNCVVACSGCEPVCQSHAISFPDFDEFTIKLDELKEKYK